MSFDFAAHAAGMIGLGIVLQMGLYAPRLIGDLLRDFVRAVTP